MKYIDEYRDPALARALITRIEDSVRAYTARITIMEVCGSHTHAIGHFGLRKLLPEGLRLISGPGCPVCVTSIQDVDVALYLAGQPHVIFVTFGDMLRVPGTHGNSLQKLRASGADVRVVASPLDCIRLSCAHPDKAIVFMGIGFETTAPTIAAMVMSAKRQGLTNISVFSVHKVVPPAMQALIDDPSIKIDGFLCPGHVSVMIGSEAYGFIAAAGMPAVVTGFEPVDILEGIAIICEQLVHKQPKVEIQYTRGVTPMGNRKAIEVMYSVFEVGDAIWRGIGTIPGSGLKFRPEYADFDAQKRFSIPAIESEEVRGCACGDILRGAKLPEECPLFAKVCTPHNPIGPCMVSSEGSCAAYYKYR